MAFFEIRGCQLLQAAIMLIIILAVNGDAMVSTWMWKPELQAEAPLAS